MASNKLMTTVQTPSRFALPTCGHAFDASVRGTDLGFAGIGTSVERERTATPIKGGLGFATAYVPGTTAWSPPTS
ncbi:MULTISPECIES: hypothetical protein [Nocardioides]|uniref:Uncharacterized protein n=1 Tax=Nocardioides lianchengensis TaxID=1045774 RepID=A0A1G6K6N4_9ACTN|nr:hypothetical protein [Nocardioides lianchengensis]NYG08904.1 hypothetical protein [Nocardioides lianchengensis]SDC26617.1 hypothetical protein SAMN05421872_101705 [Nocardioides lianchengensis]